MLATCFYTSVAGLAALQEALQFLQALDKVLLLPDLQLDGHGPDLRVEELPAHCRIGPIRGARQHAGDEV